MKNIPCWCERVTAYVKLSNIFEEEKPRREENPIFRLLYSRFSPIASHTNTKKSPTVRLPPQMLSQHCFRLATARIFFTLSDFARKNLFKCFVENRELNNVFWSFKRHLKMWRNPLGEVTAVQKVPSLFLGSQSWFSVRDVVQRSAKVNTQKSQ